MSEPSDVCSACGERPVCALAEAVILVVARDYRGVVTRLCRACGAGEEHEPDTAQRRPDCSVDTAVEVINAETGRARCRWWCRCGATGPWTIIEPDQVGAPGVAADGARHLMAGVERVSAETKRAT